MISCGKSDIGRKRSENQDSYLIRTYAPEIVLAVVCDGMGGVHGGREASRIAAERFASFIDAFFAAAEAPAAVSGHAVLSALTEAVFEANEAVLARTKEDPSLRGMGTTLVSTLRVGGVAYTVNVGDSRLYRVSCGTAEQITKDHSLVQYLVDIGRLTPEEAATAPNRNIITKAVGTGASIEPDTFVTLVGVGDVLLLCSDGLSGQLSPETIASVLTFPEGVQSEENALSSLAELIRLANEQGGPDNITAVLVAD